MGIVLALAVEALLVLVVLTIGSAIAPPGNRDTGVALVRFKAASERARASTEREKDARKARAKEASPAARASSSPAPDTPEPVPPRLPAPRPSEPPPQLLKLSPKEMATLDIAVRPRPPAAPDRPRMGPMDTRPPSLDSPRVSGAGPNGEPLYAASWYREPYDDELRGYLSTASGPGWGLIACRTAPDYRVEDCVKIDEYPTGSNIARSVLAAAWQFRVRPPRIGGEPKIGEWVRIRIDYDMRRR